MTALDLVLLAVGGAVGAVTGRWARLPMWPLTGAIAGGAVVHLLVLDGAVTLPVWWSLTAQVLVGAVVGSGIARGVFREFRVMLLPGVVAVVSIVGVGVAAGLLIAATGRVDEVVAVLGTVPGGVGEMVAAAEGLNADSAVVASMHVVRLALVLTTMPLLISAARRFELRHLGHRGPRRGRGSRDTGGDGDE